MTAAFVDILLIVLVAVVTFGGAPSAEAKTADSKLSATPSDWRLPEFLVDAQSNPAVLIENAQQMFAKDATDRARRDPAFANAWQDRLAMLSALSHIFDPSVKKISDLQKQKAAKIIEGALLGDPALLVRDAAVESMRRVNRMRPGYLSKWKSSLEKAFMSPSNQANGEGYFIRETILSAMREGSLRPSKSLRLTAQGDTNSRVRARLDEWNTAAF